MRSVRQTATFKRDLKREIKGPSRYILKKYLWSVVSALAMGEQLDPLHRDHSLWGNWRGHRECHLAPDLLLLYFLRDNVLTLVRLGSHAELFGS